jgi:hypothetical protein
MVEYGYIKVDNLSQHKHIYRKGEDMRSIINRKASKRVTSYFKNRSVSTSKESITVTAVVCPNNGHNKQLAVANADNVRKENS